MHDGAEAPANEEAQSAAEGSGPLLQRDYWGVLAECTLDPGDVADLVARRFPAFAPPSLVRFGAQREDAALEVGDVLDVEIRGAGTFRVRVLHRDRQSLTLATMKGHPEAGRITFGAYRADDGAVVFHIRSRARAASGTRYAGFRTLGEAMQTETWSGFIDRVAAVVAEGVRGVVHADTTTVEEEPADGPDAAPAPTFRARGG